MLEEPVGVLMSGEKDAWELTRIEGSPSSVEDIWSGITLVHIDCVDGAERCGGGRGLLARN